MIVVTVVAEGLCGHQGMALPVGSKVRVGVDVKSTDLGFKMALRRPQDEADKSTSVAVSRIAEDRRSWGYVTTGPDGQVTGSVSSRGV